MRFWYRTWLSVDTYEFQDLWVLCRSPIHGPSGTFNGRMVRVAVARSTSGLRYASLMALRHNAQDCSNGRAWFRDALVDHTLQDLTLEELYGYIPSASPFDTYTYAVCAVHRYYRDDDLEKLQANNFAFWPLEIIQKTLENTTQLAKAIVNAPTTRHLVLCLKCCQSSDYVTQFVLIQSFLWLKTSTAKLVPKSTAVLNLILWWMC